MTRLHQAIHGYSDGHRLIAASRRFTKQSERTLLIMSDLSGSSMPEGFESYLTGYGLQEGNAYAVGRTWYAPEMERPGCVWTHTFIIERGDLRKLVDLQSINALFKRPRVGQEFDDYMETVIVEDSSKLIDSTRLDIESQELVPQILHALYSRPDRPVLVKANNARQFESLVIALWSQQWPDLRMAFSFCTGSIDLRRVNRIPLDLQIAPAESYVRVKRQVQDGTFLDHPQSDRDSKAEEWVHVATADLKQIPDGQLTKFLRRYGPDAPENRSSFAKLSNTFVWVQRTNNRRSSVAEMLKSVAVDFPQRNTARALKIDLFGPEWAANFPALKRKSELEILRTLILTNHDSAFDPQDLKIRERASSMWRQDSNAAAKLILEILSLDQNPIRDQFLKGAADGVTDEAVIRDLEGNVRLMGVLMRLNPGIGALDGVWRGPLDNQLQMFDLLVSNEAIEDETARSITSAILNSRSDGLATKVVEEFGSVAVTAALEWGSNMVPAAGQPFSDAWLRALSSYPREVLAWMESERPLSPAQIAIVTGLLDPHSSDIRSPDPEIWMPLFAAESSEIPRAMYRDAMVFLLALGLHNPGHGAEKLVANSFGEVHEAAEVGELSYSTWSVLKDQLPHLSWWRDWDIGERLRLGLIRHFSEYNWPIDDFLQATRDGNLLEAVVKSGRARRADRQYLGKVAAHVDKGSSMASDLQKIILAGL